MTDQGPSLDAHLLEPLPAVLAVPATALVEVDRLSFELEGFRDGQQGVEGCPRPSPESVTLLFDVRHFENNPVLDAALLSGLLLAGLIVCHRGGY